MAKFNVGDSVQLISGGPSMTVRNYMDEKRVNVDWFSKSEELQSGNFYEDQLKTFTPRKVNVGLL